MPRVVPEEKLPAFNVECDEYPAPFTLACHLMLYAGLRINEVATLTWGNLVLKDQVLAEIELQARDTKNARTRTVPIAPRLLHTVALAWRALEPRPILPNSLHVLSWPNRPGKLETRTIQRWLTKVGQAIGVHRLHPHMLRHTFATRLLRQTNLRVVQEALGHRRLQTTQIYTHPTQEEMAEAIRRM